MSTHSCAYERSHNNSSVSIGAFLGDNMITIIKLQTMPQSGHAYKHGHTHTKRHVSVYICIHHDITDVLYCAEHVGSHENSSFSICVYSEVITQLLNQIRSNASINMHITHPHAHAPARAHTHTHTHTY